MNSTQGKRNRINGHNFERETRKKWYEAGWLHVLTSRSESKNADDMGLDLVHTAPFGVQCKYSKTRPNYINILANMPGILKNIIFHKMPRGKTYIIMEEETFWDIVNFKNHKDVEQAQREGRHDLGLLQKRSSKPKSDKTKVTKKKTTKEE